MNYNKSYRTLFKDTKGRFYKEKDQQIVVLI